MKKFVFVSFLLSIMVEFFSCSTFISDIIENTEETETTYTVEHWKQSIDGKYILDKDSSDTKNGISFSKTEAKPKDYTGFNAQPIKQEKIKKNGSTVVKIYYDRVKVNYIFEADGGSWGDESDSKILTGLFGESVQIPENPSKIGYSFKEWNKNIPATFEATDISFLACWNEKNDTAYTVEHYFQETSDFESYFLKEDENEVLCGTTGSLTSAEAIDIQGFTAKNFKQENISADGSTVVKIYYDRNPIIYSFNPDGGNWNGEIESVNINGLYGCSFEEPNDPMMTGYSFIGWSSEVPHEFGSQNLTFNALWSSKTDTKYKVEHWKQNVEGNSYVIDGNDTQILTGTTNQMTNAAANTYAGFTSATIEQDSIKPDGSTVIRIYYDRNQIT